MRHDVFISYSEEDKLAAGTICQALEAAGIRCWIAPRDIQEGEDWTAAIMCGIAQCRAMVLIFSRHANLSSHVYREVGHAFNHGLTVIPFRIEDIEAEEKLLYYLGSVQWLNAFPLPVEEYLSHLAAGVSSLLAKIPIQETASSNTGSEPKGRTAAQSRGSVAVGESDKKAVVNLYTEELGNPQLPEKFEQLRGKKRISAAVSKSTRKAMRQNSLLLIAALLVAGALAAAMMIFWNRPSTKSANVFPSAAILEKSVAVLPFENLSRDPDNAYFATGIQDEILTRLAKISALKVISRSSTRQYAAKPGNLSETAHQLNAANILEGSVQRAGDRVHINVQLIRAAADEHLWAESYDRKLENIFSVEAEVATEVAEALRANLTGAEQQALEQKPTSNPAAYDAYLRGIALWRDDKLLDSLKATQPLEEAVRLDPTFATAWALLSRVNSLGYSTSATADRRAAAQASLDNALRLKSDLPEVQLAQAFYQYWVSRDYEGARHSFERLRTSLSNSADVLEGLGFTNIALGRWDEGLASFDQAVALNPRDRIMRWYAAWIRAAKRDFLAALRSYDEALTIWPDNQNLIDGKASVYQAQGKLDEADPLVEKLHPTTESFPDSICAQAILRRRYTAAIDLLRNWLEQSGSVPALWRTYYLGLLGDLQRLSRNVAAATISYSQARDELEQALKEQPPNAFWIYKGLAVAYAGLGDGKRALTLIDQALNLGVASRDATFVASCEETRARIAARFGQKEIAIPILERLLHTAYGDPITPALLRLDPDFDPLRSDPAFQKLCEEKRP